MKMTNGKVYYYKKKRGSLVDVICDELTYGEEVYVLSSNGNFIPTTAPSLLLEDYQVSTSWDDNGQYFILAQTGDEETQNKVIEIATKYGKETTTRFSGYSQPGRQYQVKILVDEEDFDGHYVDPTVPVRNKKAI